MSELGLVIVCKMADGSEAEVVFIDHGDRMPAYDEAGVAFIAWTTELRVNGDVCFSQVAKELIGTDPRLRQEEDIDALIAMGVDAGSFLDALCGSDGAP